MWSPLRRKYQQHSTASPYDLTADALYVGTDDLITPSAEVEPLLQDCRAVVVERVEMSPEIPETPAVALKEIRDKEDDHSDDGNIPCLISEP